MRIRAFGFIIQGMLILVSIGVLGQKPGIKFESELSWEGIQAKAKAEGKYIFMDCYATWCGPCKWMNKNIFPENEVGDFYNSHFINVAVQMDKTTDDVRFIKGWYADADTINKRYSVSAYPTYLFFAPDGHIIHRFSGSVMDKKEFIAKGQEALDPGKQYYSIMNECKAHRGDSIFLLQSLKTALDTHDADHIIEIGNYYLDCLKDPMRRDNILIITALVRSSDREYDRGFKIFLDNAQTINKIMSDSLYVESTLAPIIYEDVITPLYKKGSTPVIYWKKIKSDLSSRYPMLSAEIINKEEFLFRSNITSEIKTFINKDTTIPNDWSAIFNRFKKEYPEYDIAPLFEERKVKYYAMKKKWTECADAAYSYLQKYGYLLDDYDRNSIAWSLIFMHLSDKKILAEGVKLMKPVVYPKLEQSLRLEQPSFIDTYANLLYKMGNNKDALIWEDKAIELQHKAIELTSVKENKEYMIRILKEFETRMEKMKNGISTWDNVAPAS